MTPVHHRNPATWECKDHVVFNPEISQEGKKAIFGVTKKRLGDVFRELARRRESKIEEGHRMPDHVHMLISIPPKYCVAEVIGFIKGGEFDLDRAECRAQSAQFHGAQVLGSGLFRLDGRAGRGNHSGLHQEPRVARLRIGPACSHPIDPHPKSSRVL